MLHAPAPRRRHAVLVLAALAVLLCGATPVEVCVEPSFDAAVAVVRLAERTPGLRLRPVRPAACGANGGYRVRF
ncbi:MAG: hypothetical protein R3F65_30650, partial [bacterium]